MNPRVLPIVLICALVSFACTPSLSVGNKNEKRPKGHAALTVTTVDEEIIEVPLSDKRAIALAEEIHSFDVELEKWSKTQAVADPELREAITSLSRAFRDRAAQSLIDYEAAKRTSSGVDAGIDGRVKKILQRAKEMLVQPPTRLYVRTKIESASATSILHFMTLGDFKKTQGQGAWTGYEAGQDMKLGQYKFRLRNGDTSDEHLEDVDVSADPFVFKIFPRSKRK